MKNSPKSRLSILASLVIGCLAAMPATSHADLVHLYEFNGNMDDTLGGVSLINNGGLLDATTLTFGANNGPTLNAEASLAATYSIGLRFLFSDANSYRKVVDFKNLASDNGQYVLNGLSNFYPVGSGLASPANTYVDLVLTRDGGTGLYTAYQDGASSFSFTDSSSDAIATVSGSNAIFRFFQDDNVTSGHEASPGVVSEIRIWDTALTAGQVESAFAPVTSSVPDSGAGLAGILCLLTLCRLGSRHQARREAGR